MPYCPDFSWDRVNFLPRSCYVAEFWIEDEKNVDSTLVAAAEQCCTKPGMLQRLVLPWQSGAGVHTWFRGDTATACKCWVG